MAFQLDLTKTPTENIRDILSERTQYALNQLRDSKNQDKAVHETRKSFKQIRATLRLIRPAINETIYQSQNAYFRGLAAQLAPLRDGFVAIETLDMIRKKYSDEDLLTLIDEIHASLTEQYTQQRENFLHSDATQSVIQALEAYTIPDDLLSFSVSGFNVYRSGLEKTYQRGRKELKRVMRSNDSLHYHEWRKSVKYLWNQIRLLTPLEPVVLGEYATNLKILSEKLGSAHDILIVEETITQHPAMKSTCGVQFRNNLEALRIEYERDTHAPGTALYEEKRKAFGKRIAAYVPIIQSQP